MRTSPITAARQRHGLAEVARRSGIEVTRDSGSVTVRCLFPRHGHYDLSPSLRLHLETGLYTCFGCGAHGDVVEWVQTSEGVTWREAIALLDAGGPLHNAWSGPERAMDLAGSRTRSFAHGQTDALVGEVSAATRGELEHLGTRQPVLERPDVERTAPARVHGVLALAWRYDSCRALHDRGVAYLQRRAIDVRVLEAVTRRCEVGHSPARADGLVNALRGAGVTDDELVDAGLARRRGGEERLTDVYRQRVLVPVREKNGRISGLVGRNVGDPRWPTYLNPPRTAVYDKSVDLYQPLRAPMSRDGHVVVVEGTLDAMAIATAAIRAGRERELCPVTQSGRELSLHQIERVLSLHPAPPVIAFDGDAAGAESNERVSRAVARTGRPVMVTTLPDGHDPASWLEAMGDRGLDAWICRETSTSSHDAPRPVPTVERGLDPTVDEAAPSSVRRALRDGYGRARGAVPHDAAVALVEPGRELGVAL